MIVGYLYVIPFALKGYNSFFTCLNMKPMDRLVRICMNF